MKNAGEILARINLVGLKSVLTLENRGTPGKNPGWLFHPGFPPVILPVGQWLAPTWFLRNLEEGGRMELRPFGTFIERTVNRFSKASSANLHLKFTKTSNAVNTNIRKC